MVSLAVRILMDLGVTDPQQHLFLATSRNLATLVLARAPLTVDEVARLTRTADSLRFRVLLSPASEPQSAVLRTIVGARSPQALEDYTSSLELDLTPPTDDRPFFFNQLPLTRAYLALEPRLLQTPGVVSGNIIASLTLLLILAVSIFFVVITIVLPLRSATRQSSERLVVGGTAYFLLIGLGFMFIEVGLLQRLSVFLGHPTYSLSIVLFSIVLFTGVGSLLSEDYPLRSMRMFCFWAGIICVYTC